MNLVLFNDGWHAGPLFVPRIIRPVVRTKGKIGIIHRKQTRRATPPWVDMKAIKLIYAKARRLTAWLGELYVVDHIVPKIHPSICGLHVEWNLRIIHWRENAKKGSRWPDTQLNLFENLEQGSLLLSATDVDTPDLAKRLGPMRAALSVQTLHAV